MHEPGRWSVWTLRSHLSALLMVNIVLTLALAGSAVLLYRIPRIERASALALQQDVREMRERVELLLRARQMRLDVMGALLRGAPEQRAGHVLDHSARDGLFALVYRVSGQGRVLAVGAPDAAGARRQDLVGNDLSANSLFLAVADEPGVAWSGRYLSALTGQLTTGVAYRAAQGELLMAEVPIAALLEAVQVAAGAASSAVWVVDRGGEVIADIDGGQNTGKVNIHNWPLMASLRDSEHAPQVLPLMGADHHVATAHSRELDWYFVGYAPVGLANPGVRAIVLDVTVAFLGCVLVGLLVTPFWAYQLARPLQAIVARAAQTMRGDAGAAAWPLGPVAEFNRLARHLAAMAASMREREQKFQAIFNASPVPMVVTDARNAYRVVDANDAWCQVLQFRREDVLGRTGLDLQLFTALEREDLGRRMAGATAGVEFDIRRRDGQAVPIQVFAREVELGSEHWMIWASVDLRPMRGMEQQLRDLNQQLEARVQRRTQALASANADLSLTVEQLRLAQKELVRAEKMAALGSLVASVAHELNTPVGNGVMAVSAMADAAQAFRLAMDSGVRRSDLEQLVQGMETGADIAGRNLRRAAELVASFKQVAVDQATAQRRSFEVGEVVHEMITSLAPSFARKPWRIEVDVPASGLRLDSYPGALGQTLGNLIQNAVLHGFDGRDHGTVRITAGRGEPGWVWLRVADDGKGIATRHIGRIFDPFMTTKKGRGGTGLGLHISHNAVVNLMGGTLAVDSREGDGACFALRLPVQAPQPLEEPSVPDALWEAAC